MKLMDRLLREFPPDANLPLEIHDAIEQRGFRIGQVLDHEVATVLPTHDRPTSRARCAESGRGGQFVLRRVRVS